MNSLSGSPVRASVGDGVLTAAPVGFARWNVLWWMLFVGVATLILCFPFFRYVFWLGDEGVLLHGADRMLSGQKLYVDFFEFHPPGGFLITAAWLGMLGTSMWAVRLLAIIAIAGIACFTFLACRQACKQAAVSAMVALGWVIASQGDWTGINHHYFTTLFSMVTAWLCLASVESPERQPLGPLLAGLAAGAAAMVTPTRGVFAILAGATAFLAGRRMRGELFAYVLSCFAVPVCVLVYVIYQGAFVAAFNDVIVWTATQYSSIQSVPFGIGVSPRNLPLKYVFQIGALLTLFVTVRDWRSSIHDRKLRVCAAFGLAGFAGCFPRADMIHIGFASPLILPLLVYCISRITASWPRKYQYALTVIAVVLAIPSIRSSYLLGQRDLGTETMVTPRGIVAFGHAEDRWLVARIAATPLADTYFFYPYMPMLPFIVGRKHVSKYDILLPGYSAPSEYREACISAMRRATWVVINRGWTDPVYLKRLYPTLQDAAPPEKRRFELALERGFELVTQQGSYEMRRRVEGVDETACAGITE